jgi:DNA helicase HerA-like ATPase
MTPIYIADEEVERGIFWIGQDERDLPVKISINPLFGHLLVAGTTTVGKTHLLLILCEEFIPHRVPCLVIDPHGEFIHLPEFNRERVELVEDLRMENLAAMMQQRKIVVWNLLGLTKKEKVQRVAALLTALMTAKENDYRQADEDMMLLELPPMFVMIDEADIFAPNFRKQMREPREAVGPVMDILNKGAKFGLGAIVATQRITRMEIDVRSQCNSAFIFRMSNDPGSLQAVHSIDYIPKPAIEKIKGFAEGQCIVAGILVHRPRVVFTRDIKTKRAKNRNYEKMLGIERPQEEDHVPRLAMNREGDLIDEETGDVVEGGLERLTGEDLEAFSKTKGDGVILRSHLSPEEQKILNKLRKPNDKDDRLIG